MTNQRTKYTEEYRRETADYIISTGRPVAAVAAELGLHQKTASRWVTQRKKVLNGEVPTPVEDAELRALRKHNRELEMENEFLKNCSLFRKGAGVVPRYQLMFAERANYRVRWMAAHLEVSRSGFYSWMSVGCPEDDWSCVREAVHQVWTQPDRRFGARFILAFLPDKFEGTTLYRVRKCMRELGMKGCTLYKSKRTTIPDKNAKPKPDLVRRDFTSPIPTYKLVGDITYLRTGQG